MPDVTIVMYHYVRNLDRSRYPEIKGLTVKRFKKQLNYLEKNYTIVRMEDCIEYLQGGKESFPENAALLTFDDGYLEHFTEVFPLLDQKGYQGSFFPPVQSTVEPIVLDVNKIHFILASADEPENLLEVLSSEIWNLKAEFGLEDPEYYYCKITSKEHPYDPIEVIRFKRVLQRELPYSARQIIISKLFDHFVGVKEEVFSNELYMNEGHLKTLIRCGMFVGGHGYSHKWLNAINSDEQTYEIEQTKQFLDHLGVESENQVMCYPYGGYDDSLISGLKKKGFVAGLTTEPKIADLNEDSRFRLSRFDTNEIRFSDTK